MLPPPPPPPTPVFPVFNRARVEKAFRRKRGSDPVQREEQRRKEQKQRAVTIFHITGCNLFYSYVLVQEDHSTGNYYPTGHTIPTGVHWDTFLKSYQASLATNPESYTHAMIDLAIEHTGTTFAPVRDHRVLMDTGATVLHSVPVASVPWVGTSSLPSKDAERCNLVYVFPTTSMCRTPQDAHDACYPLLYLCPMDTPARQQRWKELKEAVSTATLRPERKVNLMEFLPEAYQQSYSPRDIPLWFNTGAEALHTPESLFTDM